MLFNVTDDDVKRSQTATPGWVVVELTDWNEEVGKDKESLNGILDVKIVQSERSQDVGIPIRTWFPEKYPGMILPLLVALGGQAKAQQLKVSKEVLKGKRVDAHVSNGLYNGKVTNQISDWAPLGTHTGRKEEPKSA